MGRHSAPDDGEEPVVESSSSDAPVERGTHADLRMIRENPSVRARCAAGAVVPFVLYIAVMIVIGRADAVFLWVWVPIVVAGILVGAFLDLGYRSARRGGATRR